MNKGGRGKEVAQDIDIAVNYILRELNLTKVHLIGHSWGATVSGYYATLFPEKVEKLILFAPFVERLGTTSWEKTETLYQDKTGLARTEQFYNQVPKGKEVVLAKEVLDHWGNVWEKSDPTSRTRNPVSVRYPLAWRVDLYNCWNGNCFLMQRR